MLEVKPCVDETGGAYCFTAIWAISYVGLHAVHAGIATAQVLSPVYAVIAYISHMSSVRVSI